MSETCYFRYIDSVSGEHVLAYVAAPVEFVRAALKQFSGPDVVVAAELEYVRHRKQVVREIAAIHRETMLMEFV